MSVHGVDQFGHVTSINTRLYQAAMASVSFILGVAIHSVIFAYNYPAKYADIKIQPRNSCKRWVLWKTSH